MSRNLSRLAFMAATVLIGWAAVSLIGSVMMSMNDPEILLNVIIISGAAYSGWILSDMWVDDIRNWFKR